MGVGVGGWVCGCVCGGGWVGRYGWVWVGGWVGMGGCVGVGVCNTFTSLQLWWKT